MSTYICYRCGEPFAAPADDETGVRNCPECGHPILIARERSISAVRYLRKWVLDSKLLPEDLAARVDEETEETLLRLLMESEAATLPLEFDPEAPVGKEPGLPPQTGLPPAILLEPPPPAPVGSPEPGPPLLPLPGDGRKAQRKARETRAGLPVKVRSARGGPSIWQRLGPVFAENLLFALAAFLIIAGALYFVTTAWTTMTGSEKLLVVTGGIEVLGVILFLGGRAANRAGTLPELEHVLLVIVAFLLPVAAVPAGLLLAEDLPIGLLASAAVLASGWFAVRAAARIEGTALTPWLPIAATALSGFVLLAPFAGRLPTAATAFCALVFLGAIHRFAARVVPEFLEKPGAVLRAGTLLSFAHLVFAGSTSLAAFRAGFEASASLPVLGVALSAVGAAAVLLERGLTGAGTSRSGRWAPILVIALAAAVAGTAAGAGNERALLAAAAIGAFAALIAGYRLPIPALLVPGLLLAAIAYLNLPAPFRAFFTMLRDKAAWELGYEPKKLPLAWYGITYIPFVAICGLCGARLVHLGRMARGRVVLHFTVISAVGLAFLAIALRKGDLRAPAAVLAAQGALLLAIAPFARDRSLALLGALGMYAGIAFGLHHLEVPVAVHIAGLVLPGLLAMGIATRLMRRDAGGTGTAIASALFDATAVAALVLTAVLIAKEFPRLPGGASALANAPATWPDLPASLLLAGLLCLLGVAYRRPEGGFLGILVLSRAAEAALDICRFDLTGEWRLLFFVGASALIFPASFAIRRAMARIHRPHLFEAGSTTMLLVPAAVGLHLLGMIALVETGATWPGVGGLVAAAAMMLSAGIVLRVDWASWVAASEMTLAGPLAAVTLGGSMQNPSWLPGLAASIAVVNGLAFFGSRVRRLKPLAPALASALAPMTLILLLVSLAWILPGKLRLRSDQHPQMIAFAALVTWVAVRLSHHRQYAAAPNPARFAGLCAGLLTGVLAVSMLDFLSARSDIYVIGLVAAGWATVAAAGKRTFLTYPAAVPFVESLMLAAALGLAGKGSPAGLLAGFLLIAASGRLVGIRHREFGSLLLVLGALGAVSLALSYRVLRIEPQWQPTILLLFTAAVILLNRVRHSGVTTASTWTIAAPVMGAAALFGVFVAVWVARFERPLDPEAMLLSPTCLRITVGAFVLAAIAVALRVRGIPRRLVVPGAALLATFAVAPVNILLAGTASVFWRPDIEVALLAIVLALLVQIPDREKKWTEEFSWSWLLVYSVALLALGLTALQFLHPSTPITFFLASLAPLALFLRGRWPEDLSASGVGMLIASWALTLYLVPRTGAPPAEVLLLLAAVSALFAVALLSGTRILARRSEPWLVNAVGNLEMVARLSCIVSIVMVAWNALDLEGRYASPFLTGCGIFSSLTVAAIALRSALSHGRRLAAHGAVWSLLTLYLLLEGRTRLLDFIGSHHCQALAMIGIAAMLVGRRWPKVEAAFRREGLLLSVPAIVLGLLGLQTGWPFSHEIFRGATSALFLAAAAWGLSAWRTRSKWQGAISAALVNFAVFAFWRRQGIVDLAFYGIPPGLTLLLGSEVLRGRIEEAGRKLLFAAGAVLLYGSVGIQVLRVEEPTHALVLFGLGLATVILGFRLMRNDILMTGTAVVVLDVVAYFLKHGLSETFLGAALLVAAGLIVLTVATRSARHRRQAPGDGNDESDGA